jgi:hypothetical protein
VVSFICAGSMTLPGPNNRVGFCPISKHSDRLQQSVSAKINVPQDCRLYVVLSANTLPFQQSPPLPLIKEIPSRRLLPVRHHGNMTKWETTSTTSSALIRLQCVVDQAGGNFCTDALIVSTVERASFGGYVHLCVF